MAEQENSEVKQDDVGAVRPSEAKTGNRRFFGSIFTPEERNAPFHKSWMASNTSFEAPPSVSTATTTEDAQSVKLKRYQYESFLKDRWTVAIDSFLRSFHNVSESPDLKASNRASFTDTEKVSSNWFHNVIKRHSEDARAYHTLVHLEEIFGYLELLLPSNPQEINQHGFLLLPEHRQCILFLATFFHDAIYDPRSGTNEEDSAELFQKFVKELLSPLIQPNDTATAILTTTTPSTSGIDVDDDNAHKSLHTQTNTESFDLFKKKLPSVCSTIVDAVLQIVHATKSHSSNVHHEKEEVLELTHIFLDADLSVLGKIPEAYDAYAALIRQEYKFVPKDDYCQKRADILEKLIGDTTASEDIATATTSGSNALFRSPKMKAELEQQAIHNLRREIAVLRSGSIPGQ